MNIYYLQSIETPRLIIRPVKSGDEVVLNQAINRSLESLQRWMPWALDPSLQATKDHIDRGVTSWQSGRATELPMIVIHKADNKIIAGSGFNDRSVPVVPMYEIGYWLDVDYRGQGLVTELVIALTRYALEAVGAQRVQMCMHRDNEKSMAVAKRCGFTCEVLLKNERRDCVSQQLADSYLFACCDVLSLPPLEVTWQHKEKTLQPLTPTIIKASEHPVVLPVLETQRLTLIPPREQDTLLLHQALLASINEVGPRFSWATSDVTQQQMAVHVAEGMLAAKDVLAYGHLFYLVWDKQQDTLLGEVWCNINDWAVLHTGIGYWFDSRQTGHGYATEAVARLTQYAFQELNANRVYLDVAADNHSSLKLAKRLGFVHEGTLKHYFRQFITNKAVDAEMFAMTDLSLLTDA